MKVMIENIITKEKITVDNLEKAIKKLSIRRENLQEDRNIVPFENDIFAVFRYNWYLITVYETLDNIMLQLKLKPLPIAMTHNWVGEWKPFVME